MRGIKSRTESNDSRLQMSQKDSFINIFGSTEPIWVKSLSLSSSWWGAAVSSVSQAWKYLRLFQRRYACFYACINFIVVSKVEFNSNNCGWDYLEIRNGASSNGPLISKRCGRGIIPAPITSSSNYLFLRFNTDGSVTGRGWQISFQEPQFTTARVTTTIPTTTPTPSK